MNQVYRLLCDLRRPRHWMPREQWDALVAGDGCPLCTDLGKSEDRFSFLIASLQVSNLRLSRNQYASGYCLLIYREHATELDELSIEMQSAFMCDLVRAGAALRRVFKPDKMNYPLLGNAVPHLHWHIVPRYWGDPAPGRPLDAGEGGRRFLQPAEYSKIIVELQMALQSKVNDTKSGCS